MMHATGDFKIESWDEVACGKSDNNWGFTRTKVIQAFRGDIDGAAAIDYVTVYRADKSTIFTGYAKIVGSLGGRSGTFTLQIQGTFDGKAANGDFVVVDRMATGALAGLQGRGTFHTALEEDGAYSLEYVI